MNGEVKEKTALTAADWALYLGHEAAAVDIKTGAIVNRWKIKGALEGFGNANPADYGLRHALILRPLSGVTGPEARHLAYIHYGPSVDTSIHEDYHVQDWWLGYSSKKKEFSPEMFAYLLSIGIDVFGWIPAGLAIDKRMPAK